MPKITGGVDPHRDSCTIGIVDEHGIEIDVAVFDNSGTGHAAAVDFLIAHGVDQVAIEGSAGWGRHIALAVVAAGFDAREVPPQRTSSRRRARRQPKTDRIDAIATARALLAEPTLGPVQTLEAVDPLLAEIEAVLEHRRALVAVRTQMLHFIADQLAKLPTEIRDQIGTSGKIEARLRRLERIQASTDSPAGSYRLGWLVDYIDRDRQLRREIRQLERLLDQLLDRHGTTLREEPGIATINAATLLVEVGDPTRFATESKFARWCGAGAVAMSSGEGTGQPVAHRVDWHGNGGSTRFCTSRPSPSSATSRKHAPTSNARSLRARPAGWPGDPTSASSPTGSSDACGKTTDVPTSTPSQQSLDKGAPDTPAPTLEPLGSVGSGPWEVMGQILILGTSAIVLLAVIGVMLSSWTHRQSEHEESDVGASEMGQTWFPFPF